MKLTDYCILFATILLGFFVINDLKIKVVNENQMSQIMLNNNMDEIVVDGLTAGFVGLDANGEKQVDLDIATSRIFEEISILFFGRNNMRNMAEKYVKSMIYVDNDGYYLYEGGKWNEKQEFGYDMDHSERVEVVSMIINEVTKEVPLIAYNDGESFKNTIDDNTLIIVYCGYNFMTNEFVYKNTYLSAACIKEKN